MQLTEVEAAFRIHKSDLALRPVWYHLERRVQADILVCFLTYVVWKPLALWSHDAGLGDEPRKIFAESERIGLVDVVLPTRNGILIRKRCGSRPTEHQAINDSAWNFQTASIAPTCSEDFTTSAVQIKHLPIQLRKLG